MLVDTKNKDLERPEESCVCWTQHNKFKIPWIPCYIQDTNQLAFAGETIF